MKLLVTGGTGFIGQALCRRLTEHGHDVVVVTRSPVEHTPQPRLRYVAWETSEWQHLLGESDGLVNLAGESLMARRWSRRQKLVIRESRVQSARRLVKTLSVLSRKPAVLVNASAIGFYGAHGDETLTETDPAGQGFLPEVCEAWEAEARRAVPLGVRVVCLRIGVVLALGGGALSKMVGPFRWFLGGPLGSGRQWMSWIHRDDVIGLTEWVLANPNVSGSVNATAPQPVTMRAFARELGRTLRRPSWAPVPSLPLRLLLGEMADVLLTGQRVIPAAAQRDGYTFAYPELGVALQACLRR